MYQVWFLKVKNSIRDAFTPQPQGHYGKIKGQIKSHHVSHVQPPNNVPAKYQLITPYGCRDTARTRYYIRSKGQIKGKGQIHDVAHRQPPSMSLPSNNFPHLMV